MDGWTPRALLGSFLSLSLRTLNPPPPPPRPFHNPPTPTVLIAGHETTSAMLAWTLLELGENPEILARLRAEVDAVVGDDPTIDARHVEAMPYMRCVLAAPFFRPSVAYACVCVYMYVAGSDATHPTHPPCASHLTHHHHHHHPNNHSALFKESLRLHPPVTVFSRRTEQDLQLGEYTIPAGWHVGVSVYCLHRHPALWERPDDFWPERWIQGQEEASRPSSAAAAPKAEAGGARASAPAAAVAAAGSPPRYPNPQEVSHSPPPLHHHPRKASPPAAAAAVAVPRVVAASTVTPYEAPAEWEAAGGGKAGGPEGPAEERLPVCALLPGAAKLHRAAVRACDCLPVTVRACVGRSVAGMHAFL